jgi:NADH dehydrogenase (ubiquinone) Fe-S protein 3
MIWKFSYKRKNYLIYSWFVYKIIVHFLHKILGKGVNYIQIVSGLEIEIDSNSKNIYPLVFFLKKHSFSQCKSLMDIISSDTPYNKYRFSIIYNLLSVSFNLRIRLISKINEFSNILSLVSLFKSVNWSEREVFDFYGIFFIGNNDLRRILTDYGFTGFPLRKDFPLTGFLDIFYDDNQKRICYKKLELAQEYRSFKLKSIWRLN